MSTLNSKTSDRIFVVAAQVAAELYFAMLEAKQLSLTAKNARAIAVRAGQRTAGFQAITDYIEELARNTIAQSLEINQIAIQVSRLAVDHARVSNALDRFQVVKRRADDAAHLHSINSPLRDMSQRQHSLLRQFMSALSRLENVIDDSRLQMRSAGVIATSSKVEASRSGEFEKALAVIAQNIESASDQIKSHLDHARGLLHEHNVQTVDLAS